MFVRKISLLAVAAILAAPAVHAQFAVIDVGAIAQLIAQARTLESQLSTARDHLAQAQAEFQSITGPRGMDRLLQSVPRNYLPSDWADLERVEQGLGGAYASLANDVLGSVTANTVLSPQQLAALAPDLRQRVDGARRLAALSQNLAREALATTSGRFASLQRLIDALATAADQKSVLDLQARIAAENAMLQNEQTKLQTLYQVVLSEERANRQQMRERAVAGHGMFADRFQPTP